MDNDFDMIASLQAIRVAGLIDEVPPEDASRVFCNLLLKAIAVGETGSPANMSQVAEDYLNNLTATEDTDTIDLVMGLTYLCFSKSAPVGFASRAVSSMVEHGLMCAAITPEQAFTIMDGLFGVIEGQAEDAMEAFNDLYKGAE